MKLNEKQKIFVEEYLLDLNAKQAAIRAGYSDSKNSKTANKILNRPSVKAAVAARLAERAQRLELNQDRVLLEIARLAFNDPRRAFDANGALLPAPDWPDEVAAAIASVKVREVRAADGTVCGEIKEVRFWDKGKQLELAARHLGMLHDRLEINASVAELIRAARERMKTVAEAAGGAIEHAPGD